MIDSNTLLIVAIVCVLGGIALIEPGLSFERFNRCARIIFKIIFNACFSIVFLMLIRKTWLLMSRGNLKPPPVLLIHRWLTALLKFSISTAGWLYNLFSLYPMSFPILAILLCTVFILLLLITKSAPARSFFWKCLLILLVFCGGIWILSQVSLISPRFYALYKLSFFFEPLIVLGAYVQSFINGSGTMWSNHWKSVLEYGTGVFLILITLFFFIDKNRLKAMLFIGAVFFALNGMFLKGKGQVLASGLAISGAVCLVFVVSFFKKPEIFPNGKGFSILISIGLVLVVIFAMAVSFYQLDFCPLTYYYHEGLDGVKSLDILNGDLSLHSKLWYQKLDRNPVSRKCPFFLYPTAIFFKIFSPDHNWVTLRLHGVVSNGLCALFLYLLVAQIFSRPVALIAAGLLVGSDWFISQTRIGLDFPETILYSVICYYILWKAVKTANLIYYALLGLCLGLAIHFYAPARVVVIISGIFLLFKMISGKRFFPGHYRGILILVFFFMLTILVSGYKPKNYFVSTLSQDEWWYKRSCHFDISQKSGNLQDTIVYYYEWLKHNSLPIYDNLFCKWGVWDRSSFFNERILTLNPFLRICVIVSAVYSLARIYKDRYFFILIWLLISSSPAVLTNYVQRRIILMIPAFAALAALGIVIFAQAINRIIQGRRRWPGLLLSGVILILVIATDLNHYFTNYRNPSSYRSTLLRKRAYNKKMNELLGDYFLFTDAYRTESGWPDTVLFNAMIEKGELGKDIYVQGTAVQLEQSFFHSKPDGPIAFLISPGQKNMELLQKVKKAYPNSQIQEHKDTAGNPVYLTLTIDADN